MSLLPEPLPWAQVRINAVRGPVPAYGSPEWHALPDDSRAKAVACIIAAEAWRTYWAPDEHARRLHAELDAARDYEEPPVWTPEIVEQVKRTADRPSFAELCERRGEPEKAARARQHADRMREVA